MVTHRLVEQTEEDEEQDQRPDIHALGWNGEESKFEGVTGSDVATYTNHRRSTQGHQEADDRSELRLQAARAQSVPAVFIPLLPQPHPPPLSPRYALHLLQHVLY